MLALIVVCALGIVQPEVGKGRAGTPGQAEYRKTIETLSERRAGPNVWDEVQQAKGLLERIALSLPALEGEPPLAIEWNALYMEGGSEEQRERASKALQLAREGGIEGIIARIAQGNAINRPAGKGLVIFDTIPDVGVVRSCIKINLIRMAEATKNRQWGAWLDRVRENMQISRLYIGDEAMIAYLVGVASGSATMASVRDVVDSGRLDDASLAELAAILEASVPLPRPQACIEGSRLYNRAVIEYVYERNSIERLRSIVSDGPHEPGGLADEDAEASSDPPVKGWAVKFDALAKVDELHSNAMRLARMSIRDRSADKFNISEFETTISRGESPFVKEHIVLAITFPALQKLLASVNQGETEAAGTKLMVALERFRLKHDRYPGEAKEVVPEFLASVPVDPYSDEPLRYKGPRDKPYERGRPYLVYSVGYDQADDNGAEDPADLFRPMRSGGQGLDFVINPPREPQAAGQEGK